MPLTTIKYCAIIKTEEEKSMKRTVVGLIAGIFLIGFTAEVIDAAVDLFYK